MRLYAVVVEARSVNDVHTAHLLFRALHHLDGVLRVFRVEEMIEPAEADKMGVFEASREAKHIVLWVTET